MEETEGAMDKEGNDDACKEGSFDNDGKAEGSLVGASDEVGDELG